MEQLYVEDIVLLLRKCNLAEVAVKLLEKEVYKEAYHSDHVIVSQKYLTSNVAEICYQQS